MSFKVTFVKLSEPRQNVPKEIATFGACPFPTCKQQNKKKL